jgi:NADPH-dependent curcumin reductase CurA
MHQRVNRQVRLKSRPSGIPQAEHFEIVEASVPDPSNGQVLVRNIYLSVDPAMRGWVSAVANYSEPVALGAVMRSLAVGRVEESRSSDFHPGAYVTGMFGWQDYAVVDAAAIEREVGGSGLPISTSLGVLGLNGLTAYFALLEIGQPKAGETAVVSTAAGAVGSCVGQIAKIKGCRTVGIAAGLTRCVCVARSSATTPPSITGLTILSQHSMLPALRASMSTSTTRPALSAIPSCDVSRSEHGW